MGSVDVRTGADIEKGPASAGSAASGSFSQVSMILAAIGAVIFFMWTIVNIVTQANATSTTLGLSRNVNAIEAGVYVAQASTFAIALSAAWYTDVHGSNVYALCTSIYNWLVVCFWFIYILPADLFWIWTDHGAQFRAVQLNGAQSIVSCGPGQDTDLCNEFKAVAIFSLFIVLLHLVFFIIYAIKGFTALLKFNGLRGAFLLLVALNLIAYLIWFAGQLAINDKLDSNQGPSPSAAVAYIVTLSVALCTVLMIGMINDLSSATFLSLIWHPITASMLWSFVILMTRQADNKPTVTNETDQTKAVVAGIQLMAIVETLAALLTAVIHFTGK